VSSTANAPAEYLTRGFQNLVARSGTVLAGGIANEKVGRFSGTVELRHGRAPDLIGRDCPRPAKHAAAQAVRGRQTAEGRKRAPHAPPLTARTAWYGRLKGKTASCITTAMSNLLPPSPPAKGRVAHDQAEVVRGMPSYAAPSFRIGGLKQLEG
jgi:hypothetical protein